MEDYRPSEDQSATALATYFGSDDKCSTESDGVVEAGNLAEQCSLGHLYSMVY